MKAEEHPMNARADEPATIHRARPEDVERILDLLAHYDVPRGYFEPFYLKDPSYRPEHSWVAEEDGRFVAHLRVFDRRIRVSGTELRVAGVGNVITAPDQRGQGHAGQLLRAMLDAVPAEGFAYSLLRAYSAVLYERHGWAPIDQELVRATLPPADTRSVAPFGDDDLPDVMHLYDETNAGRSGTTVRSPEYWHSQLEWLREDRDGFLLSRTGDGGLAGYIRSRAGGDATEVLELGLGAGSDVGRALLSAASARSGGRLRTFLPPSLRTLFRAHEGKITPEFGLMGRVLNLPALAAALEPVWLRRVRGSGSRGGSFRLATSAGNAELRVSAEEVRILHGTGEPAHTLDERAFAHLLFRGFDENAEEHLGAGQDLSLLRTLFPAQDFVVWRSDAF
jgi:predicted N-acetyltransferase YhbS